MQTVEKWDIFEVSASGRTEGNPFTDYTAVSYTHLDVYKRQGWAALFLTAIWPQDAGLIWRP